MEFALLISFFAFAMLMFEDSEVIYVTAVTWIIIFTLGVPVSLFLLYVIVVGIGGILIAAVKKLKAIVDKIRKAKTRKVHTELQNSLSNSPPTSPKQSNSNVNVNVLTNESETRGFTDREFMNMFEWR